uniref:Uncharacterized protein n=1 Tax=Timema poppense TaxID=170557 RepID=A0A7R9D3T0_TIMPO|nr:unnamed protein product [Timema poppensis]
MRKSTPEHRYSKYVCQISLFLRNYTFSLSIISIPYGGKRGREQSRNKLMGVLIHKTGKNQNNSLTGDRPKNIGENNRVVPDFTARMLSLDPEERMDIQEMLAQPWFEDEALKERVQSSLSQHTQACSLDVPREPRRCGNNEFYFVSPQLSSASVPQGYSGIREEDDDSWNGPLETGHSHHSDEDGVHGIREEDDDSWNGPLETGHSQHSDEDGTHSESDDGDTNYTSEETDDESIGSQTSEDCSGSSSSNNSSSSSSDGDDSDGSMTSDSDSSSDDSGSYNLQDKEKDNVHSTTDSFSDSSCLL